MALTNVGADIQDRVREYIRSNLGNDAAQNISDIDLSEVDISILDLQFVPSSPHPSQETATIVERTYTNCDGTPKTVHPTLSLQSTTVTNWELEVNWNVGGKVTVSWESKVGVEEGAVATTTWGVSGEVSVSRTSADRKGGSISETVTIEETIDDVVPPCSKKDILSQSVKIEESGVVNATIEASGQVWISGAGSDIRYGYHFNEQLQVQGNYNRVKKTKQNLRFSRKQPVSPDDCPGGCEPASTAIAIDEAQLDELRESADYLRRLKELLAEHDFHRMLKEH